jgi:hypothetical protein
MMLLPLVSLVVPIPSTRIEGMPRSARLPTWSLKSVKAGKYQRGVTTWALKGHPLWSWSVKLTNELVYRLTGELSLDYSTSIQGGREEFFWQPMYLKAFNRSLPLNRREYEDGFKSVRAAQESLAAHGIPLLFVLNPNVLMLYPEILPEKYKAVRTGPSGYDLALELIKKHSVSTIDTYSYLKEVQPHFPVRFFEPTGSHWNEIGSCLAVEKLGEALGHSWNEHFPNPECDVHEMRFPPAPAELDLVKIANLLRPRDTFQPGAYLTSFPAATFKKPRRVLLVGTSFLFGLERQLLRRKIAKSTTLLFYYRQIRRDGKGPFKKLDRTKITKDVLLSYDAIIVDANVSNPIGVGYGFIKTVQRLFPEQAIRKGS